MKKIVSIILVALMTFSVLGTSVFAGSLYEYETDNGKKIVCVNFLDFSKDTNTWRVIDEETGEWTDEYQSWATQNEDGTWGRTPLTDSPVNDEFITQAAILDARYYKDYVTNKALKWALENDGEVLHVTAGGTSLTAGIPFALDTYGSDIKTGAESADIPLMEYCKIRVKNLSSVDQFTLGFMNTNINGGASFSTVSITDVEIEPNSKEWQTVVFSMRENNSATNYNDVLVKDANGTPVTRWCANLKDIFLFPFGYNVSDGTGAYKGAEMLIDYVVFGSEEYVTNYKSSIEEKESLVTGLELKTQPTKKAYHVGEKIDLTGMELIASYSDGTSETLDASAPNVTYNVSYDFNDEIASAPVALTYGGFSQSFNVSVTGIKSVEVATLPESVTFKAKDVVTTFKPDGLTIKVAYNDGTEATFEPKDFTLSKVDPTVLGKQTIDINFYGKHTNFDIDLINVIGIRVDPVEEPLYFGDKLTKDGLTITCIYSDESEVALGDAGLSEDHEIECDTSVPGTVKAKITITNEAYAINCSAEFDVTIAAPASLEVVGSSSEKTTYKIGEEFDTDSVLVSYVYEDGKKVIISSENYKVRYDFSEPGEKEVKFTDNNANLTATYKVTVEGSKATTAPKATTSPKATTDPGSSGEGGCGSSIGAGIAIVAVSVLGTGVVLARKKEN